jgi:hypothetical protein
MRTLGQNPAEDAGQQGENRMKHLKTLGLALIAVAALAALVGASSASAAVFKTSQANPSLSGNQATPHKFTVTGGSVTCEVAAFSGTGVGTEAAEQEMAPKYEKCKAFGFVNATVNMNTCKYNFHAAASGVATTVDLKSCTGGAGAAAVITSSLLGSNCKVEVFNKNAINGITFVNQPPGFAFLLEETASTNIHYKVTEDTGSCPLNGGENVETGQYTGNSEVTANAGASTIKVE